MSSKHTNTRKKMASLGLKKNVDGDYVYIDSNDTKSEFIPLRKKKINK